jgi:prepilin-type N-terminal cleavage/methylation domain-containing protein
VGPVSIVRSMGAHMSSSYRRSRGFTLIELMVTVAVIVILSMLAIPSFQQQRQRAAIRGASDQLLNFWNQARMESLKRNSMVKVSVVQSNSGATFCLGAATTTSDSDTQPCDCTQAAPSSNVCDVARYPADNTADWDSVVLTGMTLGGGTDLTSIQPAIIEPHRLFLTQTTQAGTMTLSRGNYKVNLLVDKFGRGYLCQSSSAPSNGNLSDYTNTNRVCSP